MKLVPQNYYEPQPALGGFFSWLRKAVNRVSQIVKEVSPTIGGWLDDFTNGDGNFFGIHFGSLIREDRAFSANEDIPLTSFEEVMLNDWLNNQFIPFYKPFIEDIKHFISKPPKAKLFAEYFNEAYEFLGLLNWYRSNSDTIWQIYLSKNQIKARNEFLKKQIGDLEILISRYLETTGTVFEVNDKNISINTKKYEALGFEIPNVINTSTKQIRLSSSDSNANSVLVSNSKPLIEKEDPANTKPAIHTKPMNTSKGKSNLIWFGVAAIGLWLATRKKRK